ncbi:MAG TPA: PQQ-binding-like beta-propeller repeat protein [Terriglobia bacterium]|nr:PQQ-binding-like beta-propeller repeat protein [Terriglobia bacterium]
MSTVEPPAQSAFRKKLIGLLAALLVPPVGIVLLWLPPFQPGLLRRFGEAATRLVLSGALIVLTILYGTSLGLFHVEMSGGGWSKPIFSLGDPDDDQDALESHRKELPPLPPAVSIVTPKPEAPTSAPQPKTRAVGPSWIDFRGPNRDGNYHDGPILTSFPEGTPRLLWRQPIGGGYASFVIANGRAFTIEQRRNREVVVAYDVPTGREIWSHGWEALFSEVMGGDGPRATPVWDSGRIYALGAAGEFVVLEAETGARVWSKNILADNNAENVYWGMSNAPLIIGDKVIVTPGGAGGRSIVAYNKHSGQRIWGSLDDRAAYTSPMLLTLAGAPQIVVATATRIVGVSPDDGKLLWDFPWVTMQGINSAQPIATDPNHLFVSAGYDHGSVLLEITAASEGLTARPVWESKSLKNRFNSSVLYDNHIYGFDEGIFACIDAETGERKWKGGRYGYGQALLAGDHILVLTEAGDVVILKATPQAHQEVASFPAIEGKTWNHPAIAGGILLVRNAREMAAFQVGP